MTKEEASSTMQENFRLLSFEYPGRITEALKIALKALSRPSLPSDIDEAAEKCAIREGYLAGLHYETMKRVFKAGAEWMAGQGVSVDASVAPYDDGLGLNMPDEDILSGTFKDGDKVVVQIRKKQ